MIGSGSGAASALAGDQYNRQLHPDEIAWINVNASQFAFEAGNIPIDEAKRRLILEAAAQVDATTNQRLNEHRPITDQVDEEALSFLTKNRPGFDWGKGFEEPDTTRYLATPGSATSSLVMSTRSSRSITRCREEG